MRIPQILLTSLYLIALFAAAKKNGQPKEGVYNFQNAYIMVSIQFGLLYWGGFFD